MQVEGSNAENAERWKFLCTQWARKVDGLPFPEWFHSIRASGIEEAVDIASAYIARGTLQPDPQTGGL